MTDHTKLKRLAEAAGSVEWKWWDSNSTLRLTTEVSGRHGADGDAISAYKDSVQCPEVYRAFIEAASPAAVQTLLDDLDEARNGMKYACAMRLKKEIDRLRDENEELRAQIGRAQIVELANFDWDAELTALRKDAERYRWLRDSSESIHQFYLSTPIWFTGVKFSKENVDSTIDGAMIEEPRP